MINETTKFSIEDKVSSQGKGIGRNSLKQNSSNFQQKPNVYFMASNSLKNIYLGKMHNRWGTRPSLANETSYSKVNVGDYIGKITRWPAYPNESHVHIGLPYGKDLADLIRKNKIDIKMFEKGSHNNDDKVNDDDSEDKLEKTFDDKKDDSKSTDNETNKKPDISLTGAMLKMLGFK